MITGALRGLAIAIALAAVIDPRVTTTRNSKPEIALVTVDSADNSLADRVAEELAGRFTVVHGPFAGAAGTVLVGNRLPASSHQLAGPVFAVLPAYEPPTVTIDAVTAPARAQLNARVPISVVVAVRGGNGRGLDLTLGMNGIVVDRVHKDLAGEETHLTVPLLFVPTTNGAIPLRITAELDGARSIAQSDVTIDVADQQWPVLFYDAQPAWQSTFVRRALERDPRFVVTSRILTSRGITSDAGQPPSALDAMTAVALYDVIVVGAPAALSERDVSGLEVFMRVRGGGVVLLLDQDVDGPHQRLMQVSDWTRRNALTSVKPTALGQEHLRASAVMWPAQLPAGAMPVARDSIGQPVMWRTATGAGQLIVSGALDAWKFRDPGQSGFDRFWQTLIAETADAAAPPIAVQITRPQLQVGEQTDVIVTIRDAANRAGMNVDVVRASASAAVELPSGPVRLRLWPDGLGRFRASLRAPDMPGAYRVRVSSGGQRASAAFTVASSVARPKPDQSNLVTAWANSRGGGALSPAEVEELPARLASVLQPAPRRETWHPMRSAWWIIPFALALGAEWWWRRRRGLA